MREHGKASRVGVGQFREFAGTVLRCLPDDLDPSTAQGWIDNPEAVRKVLRRAFMPPEEQGNSEADNPEAAVPADDEWFTLEVDIKADPLSVVDVSTSSLGREGWKYVGPELEGNGVYHVKLVRFSYVSNLSEASQAADALGLRLVEGQAAKPFMDKFPRPDGRGLIICGGSKWRSSNNGLQCVVLDGSKGGWRLRFFWHRCRLDDNCRWLVTEK